jgi:Dehydrogenases (flavoproteins)
MQKASESGACAGSEKLLWRNELPVREDVDIFVAGGGPAGIAAAVMAARQGASVYLAEGSGALGGMGTTGLVPAFMQFTDGVNFLAGGFGRELYDKFWQVGGAGPDDNPDSSRKDCCIHAETLKRVYDEMALAAGFKFSFFTQLIGVQRQDGGGAGGAVTHAICSAKSGVFAIRAKFFIDATGDGDLAVMAGADFEKGDADGGMMPGTLCSLWANIDWPIARASKLWAQAMVPEGLKRGVLKINDPHLPGIWRVGRSIGGGNVGHTFGVDSTDERSLTNAMIEGRRMLGPYHEFYKTVMKGYEHMELVGTAPLLGIRESRRIVGDYQMTADDFNARAVFPDEIGRYAYPADMHASKPGAAHFDAFWKNFEAMRYKDGESYGIPYRALTPRKLDNVFVTGRCVSCDRTMLSSLRVMPGCFITGQAAGVAAAMAVSGNISTTRAVNIAELQKRLKYLGAYLPNFKG